MPLIFTAGVINIDGTVSNNHIGIFNCFGNTGITINKIRESPRNHKFILIPNNASNYNVVTTAVASATEHDILSDVVGTINLIGRADISKSDFIEFERKGDFNKRTNIVKLA